MATSADQHKSEADAVIEEILALVLGAWRKVDYHHLDESYAVVLPNILRAIEAGQAYGAELADAYVDQMTGADAVGELNPDAFVGIASDGRDLDTLLLGPIIRVKEARTNAHAAMRTGAASLALITGSQIADAGRTADGVAIAARPDVQGYTRVLELPSCAQCTLLAGRVYRWNAGFERHPGCDCRHVPTTDLGDAARETIDPEAAVKAGRVHGLSEADKQAIQDGADVAQVVNAQRGMTTAANGVKTTSEGTSRSGFAYTRRGSKPRLRPESIYELADSREHAISLLRLHGYIV